MPWTNKSARTEFEEPADSPKAIEKHLKHSAESCDIPIISLPRSAVRVARLLCSLKGLQRQIKTFYRDKCVSTVFEIYTVILYYKRFIQVIGVWAVVRTRATRTHDTRFSRRMLLSKPIVGLVNSSFYNSKLNPNVVHPIGPIYVYRCVFGSWGVYVNFNIS